MRVAICIITYRREAGLARLLRALGHLRFEKTPPPETRIVVIDNDVKASAMATCTALCAETGLSIDVEHEPRQGIPLARNAALRAAREADFIAFLDDDEWPTANWLDEMLAMQAQTGAGAIFGPIAPQLPKEAPDWLKDGAFFNRKRFPDGARIGWASSNNVLVSGEFLRRTGLQFDERLRFTGGSDALFFMTARRLGLKIVWADKATVFEEVSRARAHPGWIIQRRYRVGNTLAQCERMMGHGVSSLGLRAAKGLAHLGLGALRHLTGWLMGPATRLRGRAQMAYGAGMLAGLAGFRFEEYTPERVEAERRGEV